MWRVKGFEGWAALLTALAAGSPNVTPQKWQDWFTRARLSSTLTLPLVESIDCIFKYMPADAYLEWEFQMASSQFHSRDLNASGNGGMLKRCNTDIHTKN